MMDTIQLLQSWRDGDEQEQKETFEALKLVMELRDIEIIEYSKRKGTIAAWYCDCCGKDYIPVEDKLIPDCLCHTRSLCPACQACIAHCSCGYEKDIP